MDDLEKIRKEWFSESAGSIEKYGKIANRIWSEMMPLEI